MLDLLCPLFPQKSPLIFAYGTVGFPTQPLQVLDRPPTNQFQQSPSHVMRFITALAPFLKTNFSVSYWTCCWDKNTDKYNFKQGDLFVLLGWRTSSRRGSHGSRNIRSHCIQSHESEQWMLVLIFSPVFLSIQSESPINGLAPPIFTSELSSSFSFSGNTFRGRSRGVFPKGFTVKLTVKMNHHIFPWIRTRVHVAVFCRLEFLLCHIMKRITRMY